MDYNELKQLLEDISTFRRDMMVLKDKEKEEKRNQAENGKRKAEMMRRAAMERRKESMFTNTLNSLIPYAMIHSNLDVHVFTVYLTFVFTTFHTVALELFVPFYLSVVGTHCRIMAGYLNNLNICFAKFSYSSCLPKANKLGVLLEILYLLL